MQPDDHLGNIRSVKESVFNLYFNKFGTTPDRTEWITSPAVVNAFYSPDHNSICMSCGTKEVVDFNYRSSFSARL